MIALDSSRNIMDNKNLVNAFSTSEFVVIDNMETGNYHFESVYSDNIIYLQELDLFYSIADLDKGLLYYAPIRSGKDTARFYVGPALYEFEIPALKKLLKNKGITKSNASSKIKERDGYTCQLCGETDVRTLNVHHIIPRISPFFTKSFIESPVNQITLCANCHRIEHHVLAHGKTSERKIHVERLFEINGYKYCKKLNPVAYETMKTLREYR